jgi:hypothetical protein
MQSKTQTATSMPFWHDLLVVDLGRDAALKAPNILNCLICRRFGLAAGVTVSPGVIRLTVMPYPPSSRARVRVRPITPPLDATQCDCMGVPLKTEPDPIFTMRPRPLAFMSARNARTMRKVR